MVILDGTFPPDSLVAKSGDVFWAEVAVSDWVPFLRNVWVKRRQAIKGTNFAPTAEGATASVSSAVDSRFPLMVSYFCALPPDFSVAACDHVVWPQATVLGRVPLAGESGMGSGQGLLPLCGHNADLRESFARFPRSGSSLCQRIEVHFQPGGQFANRAPSWIGPPALFQVPNRGHGYVSFCRQSLLRHCGLEAKRLKEKAQTRYP
jgi:hypothetical protein